MVFHRILDFKNGPAFLCRALLFLEIPVEVAKQMRWIHPGCEYYSEI
jgi:hypothetical protein